MCDCKKCEIYEKVEQSKEPSCCIWYVDNVVLGNKSVKDCPRYKKLGVAQCG